MEDLESSIGAVTKIGYSFVGLLCGYLTTLASFGFMGLGGFLRASAAIPLTIYAIIFSFPGWAFIAVPTIMFLPSRMVVKMSPLLRISIGAVLGVLSEALIWFILDRGRSLNWRDIWFAKSFYIIAALTSITAFEVYCLLLRRKLQSR